MARSSITANMTASELAAWKANNLKQVSAPVVITATKPARKSQRQEWQELRDETICMINAAKRQGYFHALPQLLQRLNTANEKLAALA